jgi:hypothetical protein
MRRDHSGAGTTPRRREVSAERSPTKCCAGVVIIIERVNLGAMPEEKSGDLYRPGELQLPLAVAAFGMDEGWIDCDQGREFPHHAKIRDLIERGPDPAVPRLLIVDDSKQLAKAIG